MPPSIVRTTMGEEFTHEFDDAREVMLEQLRDEYGEVVDNTLSKALDEQLTHLYDNRDELEVPGEPPRLQDEEAEQIQTN